MKTTKDLVKSKLITLPTGASIYEAAQLMSEKRIRHLPIVNGSNQIVGIVSERDVNDIAHARDIAIEKVMSKTIQTVRGDTPLRSAIFKLLENKISSLLITDDQDVCVGIVTTDDFLWYLAHSQFSEAKPAAVWKEKLVQTVGEIVNELSAMGI